MALADGQSELDTVSVLLLDSGTTITSIETLSCTSSMTVPCDAFNFTVRGDETDAQASLKPGVKIQIQVNGRPQLTGYIDKRMERAARGGSVITLSGRDILGPVVDSNVDPKTKFTDTMSVADVLAATLAPFGITTIYNDGAINVNVQSGAVQKPSFTESTVKVQVPQEKLNSDGTTTTSYSTSSAKLKTSSKKPELSAKDIKKLKPHEGEGTYQFLDRVLKRFGLRMWAAADGSGVIIDAPDFTGTPQQTIRHSRNDGTSNNAIDPEATWDLGSQPACVVARGVGGADPEGDRTTIRVIAINELVGTDTSGQPLQVIKDVMARYKDAKVVDQRPQLQPFRSHYADTLVARPLFLKDDESKDTDQLQSFVRHELAMRQQKALSYRTGIKGFTENGVPFAINTMVAMADEVSSISDPLYVLEREFKKDRSGGTKTQLSLILPYTLDFGVKNQTGDKKGTGTFSE